jgi:hypothetical protein
MAETKQKREEARIVAVLGIARSGQFADLREAEETSDGKTVTIRFRRLGRSLEVAINLVTPAVTVT